MIPLLYLSLSEIHHQGFIKRKCVINISGCVTDIRQLLKSQIENSQLKDHLCMLMSKVLSYHMHMLYIC